METGLRSSPYWPVLSHPRLRRILPGLAVSAVGDGMSTVAIGWLALQLAPRGQGGTWVAVAVTDYLLTSAFGGILFGRFLRCRTGPQLAGWNAIRRGTARAVVVVCHAVGALTLASYVTLLAVS